MTWGLLPSRTMREIIETTQPPNVIVGAQPFDRSRLALWLCYVMGCSFWNARERTHCKLCGTVRA